MACSGLITEQHRRAYNLAKYEAKSIIHSAQVEEKVGEKAAGGG